VTPLRQGLLVIACVVAILAIGVLDEITGPAPDLTVLYLVPISLGTYWLGLRFGLALGVAASAAEVLAQPVQPQPIMVADAAAQMAVFALAAVATARLLAQLKAVRALQQRRDVEIGIARVLHEATTAVDTPDDPRFEIASRLQAARELGGDLVLLQKTSGGLFLCVSDISGKGVPAALFTALLRSALTGALEESCDPGDVVRHVNARAHTSLPPEMFVTMFCCLLSDSELTYVNAGHEPGFLLRNDGGEASDLVSEEGMPVGIQPSLVIPTTSLPLRPNDILVSFTDGVTDSPAFDGDRDAVRRVLETERRGTAAALADALVARATGGQAAQRDDVTVLAIRRLPA
jgi:sigma-B regulation protein RsbU (phosphoserine phosphatase)